MENFKTILNKLKNRLNSLFVRYFIIHIAILSTIILVSTITIYNHSVTTIKRNQHDAETNLLNQYKNLLTLTFKEVEEIIELTAKNSNTQNFILESLPSEEKQANENLLKLLNSLKNVANANNIIVSAYVYSTDKKMIISSNQKSYSTESFYDTDWLQFYNDDLVGTHIMETRKIQDGYGNEFNVLTFIRNLPYGSSDKKGAIVVNVNVDRLYNTIVGPNNNSNGTFYVINQEGKVILHPKQRALYRNIKELNIPISTFRNKSDNFIEKTKKGDQLFTYITSMNNNWKYVYEVSAKDLNGIFRNIKIVVVLNIIVAMLLSLLLAYIITKYVSNPLQRLLSLIRKNSNEKFNPKKYKNEYEYLDNVYSSMMFDNKNLQTIVSDIKPLIKEKLIDTLVSNKKITIGEVKEKLTLLDINFEHKYFIVLTLQIDDYIAFYQNRNELESSIHKASLTKLIEQFFNNRFVCICGEIETDKLAVIINYSNQILSSHINESIVPMVHQLQEKVNEEYPFTVTIGIGRSYPEILKVHKSFKDSLNALKYKFYQGKDQIINVDDIDDAKNELYYYNSDRIKILMNNLTIADREGVKKELDLLFDEITTSGRMPYDYTNQMFLHLVSFVIELTINNNIDMNKVFGEDYDIYDMYRSKQTIHDIKTFFLEITDAIAIEISNMNSDKLPKTVERILEYVDNHFQNDISLNDVADWIGLSTTYISKVIKETTGKSYLEYVNSKRIERAKLLLASTNLTSKEIGFKVGFNNIQTFMRVFKKYEGITPGQYREKV
ncbi:helix-turn-helix domain-containing protein [Fredinandcohnia onubensis]|uniref:helix-turn-helix domain-containing protein n=1 Tax=Fredinandcohnia onubensis TaxID=1571209 RepID=UPI0015D4B2C7|nr:helix-turn-helix domain-containing protein [Fredinandcohnia onubensis]